MTKQNKIYKIVYMGLLDSMALVLSLIERMLPIPFIAPGAKLGLANLIIVISVYTLDSYKDSFIILILKKIPKANAKYFIIFCVCFILFQHPQTNRKSLYKELVVYHLVFG